MIQKNKSWLFVLFFILCISLIIPLPYYLVKPGHSHLVYEVMTSKAKLTANQNGQWLFLTVKLSQMNLITYMKNKFDARVRVIPKSSLIKDGDLKSYLDEQKEIMKNAQQSALRCANERAEKIRSTASIDQIEFFSTDVGGPSAGLMMCLGALDLLVPEDLSNGKRIAGTGMILENEQVGDVGGLELKIYVAEQANADLFLFPRNQQNLLIVEEYQKENTTSSLQFCPVNTITDALTCIKNNS